MKKKFFKRTEKHILEGNRNINPEIYNHLNVIIKLDSEGNLLTYNEAFEKQFGYKEQDFKEPFFTIFLKGNSFEIRGYFEKALAGKTQKFNAIGFSKSGKQIDINITLIPVKNNSNMEIYLIIKDITEHLEQKKELFLVQKKNDLFNKIEAICNFYYDAINDFHYFSSQFASIFGIKEEKEFTPSLKHLLRYVHPEDKDLVKTTVETALSERTGYQIEYRLIRVDQSICLVREHAEIVLDKNGHLDGLVGFIQDITSHKNSDMVLEKEKQIKKLYDNPDVGIWSIDVQKCEWISCSEGITYITGYTKEDFNNGLEWSSIVHTDDLQQYLNYQIFLGDGDIIHHQYRILNKNGDIRWVQDYTIPTLDSNGNIVRLDGLTSDITEKKLLEEKIKYLANYDLLTNIPNRNMFIEKLEQLISTYSNSNHQFAVIKLDIDGFKYINDTLGNEVGDELLKQIPNRIAQHLSSKDLLARHGGDEFMILNDKIDSIEDLKIVVNKITESLNEPFNINEYQLFITVSVGICTYPENGETSLELLRNTSLALQNAEKRGKNNYHILSHSSSIQSFKKFSIGRDLKKAVENREMILYYQPRVNANSNQIIGAEALIRWNHPEWGLIYPHEFLTIAEENGLVTEIDDWVLNEACNQIKNWKSKGNHVVPISINISAIHFMKPDWPSKVAAIIREAGIYPHDIEFEITESTILNNSEMVRESINKLKELGIKISLDDFGKGYSSLSYLTQYPFDTIKIDKSFIRNVHYNERDLHLTKSIIYLAKGLQLRVVAEGVETVRQLKILQQEQCYEIQGYLFSHPVPVNEFEALLQKKVLPPIDPEQKAKQSKRKHYRLNFPYSLEADMKLVSIAGRSVDLGVSKVLVEDISIGGLRFVSTTKLPTRGDVIYQFQTELLGESIILNGNIIWREEVNEDLMEYGIKFNIEKKEQAALSALINSFTILLKHSDVLPPYRKVNVDRYQYFKD